MYDIDKINIYWTKDFTKRIFTPEKAKIGLDNNLLSLEKEILLHPNNAHHLLMPLTNDIFVETLYKKFFVENKIVEGETDNFFTILSPITNAKKAIIFVQGKFAVGIGALSITFAAINQVNSIAGNSINAEYFVGTDSKGDPIYQPSAVRFASASQYDFSGYTDDQINTLSEIMSQLLTMYVDGVKEPYAVLMNITLQTANVVDYLIKNNVSASEITKFLSQPLIKKYLEMQKINESLHFKNDSFDEVVPIFDENGVAKIDKQGNPLTKTVSRTREITDKKVFIERVLSTVGKSNLVDPNVRIGFMNLPEFTITDEQLTKDLLERGKDNDYNTRQAYYLQSFLELQDLARHYGDFLKTQNSDTAGWADRQDAQSDLERRQQVFTTNLVPSDIVEYHDNEGLISPFYKHGRMLYYTLFDKMYAFGSDQQFNNIKNIIADKHRGSEKEKLMSTFDNDFITFLVQNFSLPEGEYNRLMKGNSVAKRVRDLKEKVPSNMFLKALQPMIGQKNRADKVDNIRLIEKKLDGYSSNDFSKSFEELYEIDPDLYTDLIKVLFFQNGLNQGIFNFFDVVPQGLRSSAADHLLIAQNMIDNAVKTYQNMTKDDQTLTIAQYALLFDLNNPAFIGKRLNGHSIRRKIAKDNGVKQTIYVDSDGKPVTLLGDRNSKNYRLQKPNPSVSEQLDVQNAFFELSFDSAKDAVEHISNSTHNLAPLAQKLLKFKSNPSLVITEDVLPDTIKGTFQQDYGMATAAFFPLENKIKISPKSRFPERMILHEYLHAVTRQYMIDYKDSKQVKELERLLEVTRRNAMKLSRAYPIENLDEFVVAIFTDPDFIRDLQKIKVDNKPLLTKLMRWFIELFNFGPEATLFHQVMFAAEDLLNTIDRAENLNYNTILAKYGNRYGEVKLSSDWGQLTADIAFVNQIGAEKLSLYQAPNGKWYLRKSQVDRSTATPWVDNRATARENSEQMNASLASLGQEVFEKWDIYFQDYSFLDESFKQNFAELVDNGLVQIQCNFK